MSSGKYYIHMDEIGGFEEGYCCGHSEISNSMFYRTADKRDADHYDDYNAVLISTDYRRLGYPCKVVPKISNKRRLEILEGG